MTTKIEWTERTWNPIAGCTRISEGCKHCYAERMAKRLAAMGVPKYQGLLDPHGRWNGQINVGDDHDFLAPLLRKKPTTWFVNSMSDLFHEGVSFDTIDRVFAVMALCPQHTFQVLTKRSARMREYMAAIHGERRGLLSATVRANAMYHDAPLLALELPLKNVWLGVSVENQRAADERIPDLLECPAAVRFLSCEPLIESVTLNPWLLSEHGRRAIGAKPGIHWVICGGESGPGARANDVRWMRSIVKQCKAAGVSCFVKQLGAYVVDKNNAGYEGESPSEWPAQTLTRPETTENWQGFPVRVLLKDRKGGDVSEWPEDLQVREMPEVLAR